MIEITAENDCERLDIFLSEQLEITRSNAQKLIKAGNITGHAKLKPSMKVLRGQIFFAAIPESENIKAIDPENIDFNVVYEDKYLLVINKPSGLVVHPAPGNWHNTLVNGLVYRYPEFRLMTNRMRPGIIHRLDAGTSGLMVVARTQNICDVMQKMFQARKVSKHYLALTHGAPKKREGILSGPIARDPDNFLKMSVIENGKAALTGYKVLWTRHNVSLVECKLFTGRTHQIRVHLSALGCPLLGDELYGANDDGKKFSRVYLHSWKLNFIHPVTGENLSFRQNINDDFRKIIHDII